MNFVARNLQSLGRAVPPWVPHGTAIGNRMLKPIYRWLFGSEWVETDVWSGIRMRVDPTECIGGNLFFSPQLYDREEREWITARLPEDGVFLDVGANIGAYTLWAGSRLGPMGRLLAIEADPDNFRILQANIAANSLQCSVVLENVGVSDAVQTLTFYRNNRGNRGANSFYPTAE